MDRRYILLSSEFRDRNKYPNPFEFASMNGFAPTNKSTARDWVSNVAPLINFDMNDYFASTDGFNAPYVWQQTGVITNPTVDTSTNVFTVSIDARGNAGAPAPVTNQYLSLIFNYDNGTTVFNEVITAFLDNETGFYDVSLQNSIEFIIPASGGNLTFTIQTFSLDQNQVYIPQPITSLNINNAYTELALSEYVQGETAQITDYDATSRILTLDSNLSLNAIGSVNPSNIIITKERSLTRYIIQGIDTVSNTIQVLVYEHPSLTETQLTDQYVIHYASDTTAKITQVQELVAGVYTLTIHPSADLSNLTFGSVLGILFFSRDNVYPFNYESSMNETKWQARSQIQIYDLELLSLQFPNKLIQGHPGGLPVNYPYFFVELVNLSSQQRSDRIIYSNNPNADTVSFVCPSMDISSQEFSSFSKFYGGGIFAPFSMKSNDSLLLRVTKPDGGVLQLESTDTAEPYAPDPFNQVSGLFSITKRAEF